MSQKLKIALLIEKNSVKAFEHVIIEKVSKLDTCEIVLIINHTNPPVVQKQFMYRIFSAMDHLVYGRNNKYMKTRQLELEGVDRIDCESRIEQQCHYIRSQDLQEIKQREIDLILKFSTGVFKGEILSLATYGVWEYAYGKARTKPHLAGLKETIEGDRTLEAVLEKVPDTDNGGYIVDSFLASADTLSALNNQNALCWKTHTMMPRNIQRLAEDPVQFVKSKSEKLYFYHDKQINYPTNKEMIKPILAFIYRNILNIFDRLFYKAQWSIYFAENEKRHPFQRDSSQFTKIETPRELFWADPFVIDKGNKSYIFFEDYVYKTKKGHISVLTYDHDTKTLSEPSTVIDTDYHQSYPFIMEYEGEIYMIPEGSKDKNVKLYKAVEFPHKWEVVRTFFEGKEAVDMTLFFYEGKWWLFANMIDEPGQSLNEELYIFYCNDFRTDAWIPHAQNPVISSIQSSRPAGKIIAYNGAFYRPSQNSVRGYGYSTNFNRIVKLTPSEYQEELVSEITPDFIRGVRAIHTYNSSDKLTVIDCVHKIRRFF